MKTIYAGGFKFTHDGKHWTAHNLHRKRNARIVNDDFAASIIANCRRQDSERRKAS